MKKQKYYTGNFNPIIGIIVIICILFVFFFINKNRSQNKQSLRTILVVNSDKRQYLPGQKVKIQGAVVKEDGNVVCNANLELEVGGVKIKDLKVSSTCGSGSVTGNPDYFYEFTPDKNTNYKIKLTNLDDGAKAENEFKVVDKKDLEITRETATRINPVLAERIPVRLIITATKDYQGEVFDTLPSSFAIPWQGPAKVTENDSGKTITWQVNLKAGETKELIYEYSTPKDVPAVYKLGSDSEWQIISAK